MNFFLQCDLETAKENDVAAAGAIFLSFQARGILGNVH